MITKFKKLFLIAAFTLAVSIQPVMSEDVPINAASCYNQGIALYQAKSYNESVLYFKKAIDVDPSFTDAYFNLAAVYRLLNQNENAISTYAKLLKINENDYDAKYEIAKTYFDIDSYSLALKYLSEIPDKYSQTDKVNVLKKQAQEKIVQRKEIQARNSVKVADLNKKKILYKFDSPTGITADSKGNIYVANYSNNYISKISPSEQHTIFIKSSLINSPVGIAADKYDNLYVANYETNNILKITQTGEISVFMTNIKKPYYLYIKNDVLYVSEQETNTVIKYDLKN